MNLPLGYRYATTYAGIRAAARDDLSLIVSGMPADGRGCFHAEPRAGRAGAPLPPASGGLARPGAAPS